MQNSSSSGGWLVLSIFLFHSQGQNNASQICTLLLFSSLHVFSIAAAAPSSLQFGILGNDLCGPCQEQPNPTNRSAKDLCPLGHQDRDRASASASLHQTKIFEKVWSSDQSHKTPENRKEGISSSSWHDVTQSTCVTSFTCSGWEYSLWKFPSPLPCFLVPFAFKMNSELPC